MRQTGDDPNLPGSMVSDWSAEAEEEKRQLGYHTDSILSGRGRGYRRGLRGNSRGRGGLPPRGPGTSDYTQFACSLEPGCKLVNFMFSYLQ